MKNGIMREDEGYDILHNGVRRTFRDVEAVAIDSARFAKRKNPGELIEIVDRATGVKRVMLPDGRLA